MTFKSPDRNIIEHIVVIVVVLVVAFLVGANIYYQRLDTRQKALFYQLQIMRNAINLYKIVEKKNPGSLVELGEGMYTFPGDKETKKFLLNAPFNKDGEMVDPFDSVYMYDNRTGWVRSSTNGYEMW